MQAECCQQEPHCYCQQGLPLQEFAWSCCPSEFLQVLEERMERLHWEVLLERQRPEQRVPLLCRYYQHAWAERCLQSCRC